MDFDELFQAATNGGRQDGDGARPAPAVKAASVPSASATLKAKMAARAAPGEKPKAPEKPKADLPPPSSDSWETEPVTVSFFRFVLLCYSCLRGSASLPSFSYLNLNFHCFAYI